MSKWMRSAVFVVVVAVIATACGSDGDGAGSDTEPTAAAVTTVLVSAPCFGLEQVDKLPEWIGGLAFGESHSISGGNTIDLVSKVGCQIEGGVLVVSEAGVFDEAYAEVCIGFEGDDIPRPELRPAPDKLWGCTQPGEDGTFLWVPHWPE